MRDKYQNDPAQQPRNTIGTAPQAGSLAGHKSMTTTAAHAGMAGSQIESDGALGGDEGQLDSDVAIGHGGTVSTGVGPESRSIASPSVIAQGTARPQTATANANRANDASLKGHVLGGKFRKVGR